jgi:hypothetical protein
MLSLRPTYTQLGARTKYSLARTKQRNSASLRTRPIDTGALKSFSALAIGTSLEMSADPGNSHFFALRPSAARRARASALGQARIGLRDLGSMREQEPEFCPRLNS